jgi:phosphate transport system protein
MPLHTDREYEAELHELRSHLLLMGARVEGQLSSALACFKTDDQRAARELIARDLEVDQLEVQVDEACVQLLAKRQPVAKDLRFVMMTLKVVTDLERIGDLASNIGKVVLGGLSGVDSKSREKAEDLGKLVVSALHNAMDAFVDADTTRAEAVIRQDEQIDERCAELCEMVAAGISADPAQVSAYLRLLTIIRSLERVADHSTNLAEMIVFLVKGRDVRHIRRFPGEETTGSGRERAH